jgi:F420-non-reducing hydrogenase iron-sulfur subunit
VKNQTGKIYLFYCANNLDATESIRGFVRGTDELKTIALPCSGKIDIRYLTKAFETGADGVAVLTCLEGECRYLEGNLRARKRVESIDALLNEIGLGKGRTIVIQVGDGKIQQAISELEKFWARVKTLPEQAPNIGVKTG